MRLEKLELSGFKSFAKATTLEFPTKITAIVGPNGSGKSNVAEAVRWVMGEQSMKSLRGKKGEDLIWNGSPPFTAGGSVSRTASGSSGVPRMGKASVVLTFDNTAKRIPIEFENVTIGRKIFRDGTNEYLINDSLVRLRDVVELMARLGLGETKHNIIGQGEVDRIVLATPVERRAMLEEALGLRIYQLKKNETERKLASTEQNMAQVEALLNEIAPHLKFLKSQAGKAEARGVLQAEFRALQQVYFFKEGQEISEAGAHLEGERAPYEKQLKEVSQSAAALARDLTHVEKEMLARTKTKEEAKRFELDQKRRELERELGRLEGRLEVEREKASPSSLRTIDIRYVQEEIREFTVEIKALLEDEGDGEVLRGRISVLVEDLEKLLDQIEKGAVEEGHAGTTHPIVGELERSIRSLQQELAKVVSDRERYEAAEKKEREEFREMQSRIRDLDAMLRKKRDEERDLAVAIERFKFEGERIRLRESNFLEDLRESGMTEKDLHAMPSEKATGFAIQELKKKVERLRARLEEIGSIDPEIVKEFQDTSERHQFLERELDDLKHAKESLRALIKELEIHIERDFKEGFAKIKEEFNTLFRVVFGGGRASLHVVKIAPRGRAVEQIELFDDDGEWIEEESEEGEEGIELSVDLPRKRIKGLAMLSGGERALTAIALLVAITLVNPPPFLVLDETDAALDEANSQRYAAILKELSDKTQLILITHNRETMKNAGILYGVTMGDDGVSRLLSLKLEEAEFYTNR